MSNLDGQQRINQRYRRSGERARDNVDGRYASAFPFRYK